MFAGIAIVLGALFGAALLVIGMRGRPIDERPLCSATYRSKGATRSSGNGRSDRASKRKSLR
jgi:hypothetical protein